MTCKFISKKQEGKVYLNPSLKESVLFNNLINIVGVDNFDKAVELYSVVHTDGFKQYNLALIKQYRDLKNVTKNAITTTAGFSEVFSEDGSVRIVFKENSKNVELELIESSNRGNGLARKFLQDFVYSYPNKDITLIVAPRDESTSFQGLGSFYQSLGFDYKSGSNFEMVRFFNKGRLYPEGYDINGEPSVTHLMNYINNLGETSTTKKEVIEFMLSSEITNTDELLSRLSLAERDGIFIFDKISLQKTKLFSKFEITQILKSISHQKAVTDLLKYLRQKDFIEVDIAEVKNNDAVTKTGKIEKTIRSEETEIKNTNLTPKKKRGTNVATGVTIDRGFNTRLAEAISYVKMVRPEDWITLQTQVKTLLEETENQALENGINIKGLRDSYGFLTQEQVLSVLNAVEDVLEGNLSSSDFDVVIDNYLGTETDFSDIKVDEQDIILDNDISELEAYEMHSLIKIGKGVYRKIAKQDYLDLLKLNSVKTLRSIEQVEQDVNKNYNKSLPTEIGKNIYLLRSNLNLPVMYEIDNSSKVSAFRDNIEADFIEVFSKWLIENQNRNFKVTEEGIYFTNENLSLEAMQSLPKYLQEELNNYAITSPTITTPESLQKPFLETGNIASRREQVMLNPRLVPQFQGLYTEVQDGSIVVTDNTTNFININTNLFELNSVVGNVSFYTPLNGTKNEASNFVLDYTYLKSIGTSTIDSNILSQNKLDEINKNHYNC